MTRSTLDRLKSRMTRAKSESGNVEGLEKCVEQLEKRGGEEGRKEKKSTLFLSKI